MVLKEFNIPIFKLLAASFHWDEKKYTSMLTEAWGYPRNQDPKGEFKDISMVYNMKCLEAMSSTKFSIVSTAHQHHSEDACLEMGDLVNLFGRHNTSL